MRRSLTVALATATVLGAAAYPVAASSDRGPGLENCTGTAPVVCHFDVPPGTYTVTAELGGDTPGSTAVMAETRRAMLPETATGAGERLNRSFTVDVRNPEGEPLGPPGNPGLDLTFTGAAPRLGAVRVTPAKTPRLLVIGDSTACDQQNAPYAGWGQQLPQFLGRGISVANYADSGESTVTWLDNPALFAAVRPQIRTGDLVLIQLAHNDKETDAATYRENLTTLVEGVRAEGGDPVLLTPIVRRWFSPDGTLNNDTALLVNGLGVNHPAEVRGVAVALDTPLIDLTALTKARVEGLGVEGSKPLYLYDEKRDNTHTSKRGATEYAAMVRDELQRQGLLRERDVS
ncbi:rhamnogalacturonan acetylesterase [Streptomyces boninensis]|uniref:rhamnogalacturonan acetylesterase n=1 Tax=Streptomyces boninensis TaxID=2039455 RepID=UPI003B2106A9